jgi:hypothetical protein
MNPDELLTPAETSAALGLSVYTLRNWRSQRINLRFVKAGSRVFYRAADVAKFQKAYLRNIEVRND